MNVFSKQEAKIMALKVIPAIINKIESDSKKIKDLPEILEVDHILAVIQFVYKVFDLEDEASDLLKKPIKLTPNIVDRYAKFLQESLQELRVSEEKILEIMTGLK